MTAIDRLLVIWGEPVSGGRHVIGHVARSSQGFRFWYDDDLIPAKSQGFSLLPEFPQPRTSSSPYEARYLFPLFAERIPPPSRSDAKTMMAAWGVERPDDQFEVLAKSGGIRATDRLELSEYRAVTDPLSDALELRVAGRRHIDAPAKLAIGDEVILLREPHNPVDSDAVLVNRHGCRAGYVPRQYKLLVGRLLDLGVEIEGRVVRQLLVPDDAGKWVVRVARRPSSAIV